jgi:transcription initiation factor IIE alpha subunit
MSDVNSNERTLARQRVCGKCRSFTTMEKVNEMQFACPLCGQRLEATVNLQGPISYREVESLVAKQFKNAPSKTVK